MRTSDAERQRKSRAGKRAKVQEIVDSHLANVRVLFADDRDGKSLITLEMPIETRHVLELNARHRGWTLDVRLKKVIADDVGEWVEVIRLHYAQQRVMLEADIQRTKAELAETSRLLAELRKGK